MKETPLEIEQIIQGEVDAIRNELSRIPDTLFGAGKLQGRSESSLEDVYTTETPDTQPVDKEQNAEARRVMMQRMGPKKYMLESGAECIDYSAGLGLQGSAPRALYKTKDGSKWLTGTDGSTRRLYWMPVPTEVKTCSEAHRSISGLDNENRLLAEC